MLKLFALYLKSYNPANTQFMKKKYEDKLKQFIERCELPEELYELGKDKEKYLAKGHKDLVGFKESYYNLIGSNYD